MSRPIPVTTTPPPRTSVATAAEIKDTAENSNSTSALDGKKFEAPPATGPPPENDDVGMSPGSGEGAMPEGPDKANILKDWNEMPRYLQFNPYVLTGYRPLANMSECFASLFYFHNETFNILTHG